MNGTQWLIDIAPDLSFGVVAGAVVGFTAKRLTKVIALAMGATFIVLQFLAQYGLVSVNWQAVERGTSGLWVDSGGMTAVDHLWAMVTNSIPFGGSFATGFLLGFRKG